MIKTTKLLALAALTIFTAAQSHAAITVDFQLSAPAIQQSAFQGQQDYLTENFNSLPVGALSSPGTLAVGNYTSTGGTQILNADKHGGAGGTGRYAFTGATGDLSIDLASSKYVGFWISASNVGNFVDFYESGNLVGTFSTSTVTDLVGAKANPNQVLASNGQTYSGALWYGNPNPGLNEPSVQDTIFAYVNAGLSDSNASFDKIVFRGQYFEFDNVTTSAIYSIDPVPSPVPEPGQVAASLLLLAGIGGYVWMKRRKTAPAAPAAA
jgi:hypothetical protein